MALLVACSSTKVLQSETAPGADLTKYKTYAFYQTTATGDTIPARFNEGIALVKEAISAQLTSRGFVQTSTNPDLLVNLGVAVKETAQTRQTDWRTDGRVQYIGQRNYSWKSEEIITGYYKEGTLDVNLVEAASKKMVWKGTVQDVLPEKIKNLPETVNKSITGLFAKFPVAVK
jgi:hypothetical protein